MNIRWPLFCRAEDRQRRARAVKGAHVVDVHHPLHDVGRRLVDRAVVAEPRVADHDVEAAELAHRHAGEGLDVVLAGDVHLHDRGAAAGVADLARGVLQQRDPARPEHDRHAFTREMRRAGQPDAGRAPGDGRDAARENHGIEGTQNGYYTDVMDPGYQPSAGSRRDRFRQSVTRAGRGRGSRDRAGDRRAPAAHRARRRNAGGRRRGART